MQGMQTILPSPQKMLTPGVTGVLILSVAGFLAFATAPTFTASALGLSTGSVLRGRIWQLLTYPFVYDSLVNLVFSGLVILFVGSAIERKWRTASFLWLWLVVSVSCGILWVLINLVMGGNAIGTGAAACSYGFLATMGPVVSRHAVLHVPDDNRSPASCHRSHRHRDRPEPHESDNVDLDWRGAGGVSICESEVALRCRKAGSPRPTGTRRQRTLR